MVLECCRSSGVVGTVVLRACVVRSIVVVTEFRCVMGVCCRNGEGVMPV